MLRVLERRSLTEEHEVAGRVAQELDEGLAQRAARARVRRRDVGERVERKHGADAHHLQRLQQHVLTTKARHALVPDGRQQLLHVRVCHELRTRMSRITSRQSTITIHHTVGPYFLLPQFDGELEPRQAHELRRAGLRRRGLRRARLVVQQYLSPTMTFH